MKMVKAKEEEMKKNHRIVENKATKTIQYYQDDVQYLEFLLKKERENNTKLKNLLKEKNENKN